MTPPTFQIDDEVQIIGPPIDGSTWYKGVSFKIDMIKRDYEKIIYGGVQVPWYPASSLRLVNKKPLSPMSVTYNYKPDDCEHGTIQVSCPCGRQAEIDSNWPKLDEDLKIGDWAQVINPKSPDPGKIFKITDKVGERYSDGHSVQYLPKNLRKLTPEEALCHITKRPSEYVDASLEALEGRISAIEKRFTEDRNLMTEIEERIDERVDEIEEDLDKIFKRLSAIEKKLRQLDGENGKFLADYREGLIKEDDQDRWLAAIEKRLDFVEQIQRTEYKRNGLWAAGP